MRQDSYWRNGRTIAIRLLIAVQFIAMSSCSIYDSGTQDITLAGPRFVLNPNGNTPLAGLLELSTEQSTKVTLVVSDGSASWPIIFEEFNTDHLLTVLGFSPGRTHTIQVQVIDENGDLTTITDSLEVTTDPLPPGFPTMTTTSQPEKMEPGVTLISDFDAGLLFIVDETGKVIWYFDDFLFGTDARRLPNGNLLVLHGFDRIVEMDMLGNVVDSWSSSNSLIPVETFHHEVFEMPSGNFLTLGTEVRSFDNYPTSETDPTAPTETANIVGDVIVEFSRDGTVLNEWNLIDLLDPYRIGYDSLSPFWDMIYADVIGGTRDWSHGNAVIYDPNDDSIIVSVRHQDAVVKISRATGELIWILGPHENWSSPFDQYLLTPLSQNNFSWPYHPHAPEVTPSGSILVFDNGNYRASPFDFKLDDSVNYSRAVEYQIDEGTMEITQIWEYDGFVDGTVYSPIMGDADLLPQTGNVLVTFSSISGGPAGIPITTARVVEVTHTTPAEKVFELNLSREGSSSLAIYRSERLEGLYP